MKPSLFLFCCLVSVCFCMAQSPGIDAHKSIYLKLNPSLLLNQLRVDIEQEFNDKKSIEIGIGGIFSDWPEQLFNQIDVGQNKPAVSSYQFNHGSGLDLRAGLRFYLVSRYSQTARAKGTYFQPTFLYKRVWYPTEEYVINGNTFQEKADKRVFGLILFIGRQISRGKWVLDNYVGVGLRSKTYFYQHYSQNGNTVQKTNGQLVSLLPSLHIGLKVGLEWKKKNWL